MLRYSVLLTTITLPSYNQRVTNAPTIILPSYNQKVTNAQLKPTVQLLSCGWRYRGSFFGFEQVLVAESTGRHPGLAGAYEARRGARRARATLCMLKSRCYNDVTLVRVLLSFLRLWPPACEQLLLC